jgi:hypothetical protein
MKNITAVTCVALILTGCATKRYTRVAPLSSVEASEYTCREIRIEQAKIRAVSDQIRQESQINFMSVMGFLGDYGLGNINEKNTAERILYQRQRDLEMAAINRHCADEAQTGVPGGVALIPANTTSGYCIIAPVNYTGNGSVQRPSITSAMPRCEQRP